MSLEKLVEECCGFAKYMNLMECNGKTVIALISYINTVKIELSEGQKSAIVGKSFDILLSIKNKEHLH